jgi:hypothetical protein
MHRRRRGPTDASGVPRGVVSITVSDTSPTLAELLTPDLADWKLPGDE